MRITLFCIVLSVISLEILSPYCHAQWEPQESGTKARLRGISVVSQDVAWASGTKGTVIRTIDGGTTWTPTIIPDAAALDFRDIHAVDAKTAYVLSIGEGEKSRIYKTLDGGNTWQLQHKNPDPKVFLDAIAFWDPDHGLALGDPVDGRYTILTTDDGGKTWTKGTPNGMPPALEKEGAFAASGTCLITQGDQNAWFGTGGGKTARVFRSQDRGRTWTVHETPIRANAPASGIFSLAFRDASHGAIVGGTYDQVDRKGQIAATTEDGGKTWKVVEQQEPNGYRSAVIPLGKLSETTFLAVGPSGTDISNDDGRTWKSLGNKGFHATATAGREATWAVGEDGAVAKFKVTASDR